LPRGLLIVVVLGSLAATGCGDDVAGDRIVRSYCTYGARSTARQDGCIQHTTAKEVRARTSSAARRATVLDRFSRDDTLAARCVRRDDHSANCGGCEEDAGPLCFDDEKANLDPFCDKAKDNDPTLFLGATECDHEYANLSARRQAAGWGPQVR
jgi:hypothetical protein